MALSTEVRKRQPRLADSAEAARLEVRDVKLAVTPVTYLSRYRVPRQVALVTDLRELPDIPGLAPREGPEPPEPEDLEEFAVIRDLRGQFDFIRSQMRVSTTFKHLQLGPWLKWRPIYSDDKIQLSPEPEGCLFAFAALADAPDDRFRDFAARWGPLGICGCDRPSGHMLICSPRGFTFDSEGLHCPTGFGWEPISVWRRYARQAAAIIRLAIAVANGGPFAEVDLISVHEARVDPPPIADFLKTARNHPDRVKADMAIMVNTWLAQAGVTVSFRYGSKLAKSDWSVQLEISEGYSHGLAGYGYLPGVLAVQLATVLTSRTGLYDCSNCGQTYEPLERKPKRGQNTFCYDCRDGNLGSKKMSARARRRPAMTSPNN